MTASGDGWYTLTLTGQTSAAIVFNDQAGKQTVDLSRGSEGWFLPTGTNYAGKVVVAKMNVDDSPKTPMRFNVRGIPTLILFKNGQAEGQKIGAVRKADVVAFLDSKL